MKTSLWIVIALVSGIVGFLTGYSVSSFSGSGARRPAAGHAAEASAPAGHAAPPAATAGYGETAAPAGYGEQAAPAKAQKPATAQTSAAGY